MKRFSPAINVLFILIGFIACWVWESSVPDFSKTEQ